MVLKFIEKLIGNPFYAFILYLIWIMIMFYLVTSFNEGNAFHFGPVKDKEKQAKFLGTPIDSWDKVIKVYIFGFFASLFTNLSNHIILPWVTNSIYDPKEGKLGMSRVLAFLTANGTFLLGSIDQILTILVVMTGQVQFFIPGLISMLMVTMNTTGSAISKMKVRT